MVREGREYSKIAPNVVIKCPLTRDGLKATRHLTDEGIKVNVTLCFSPAQAIVAAKGRRCVHQSVPRSSGRHRRERFAVAAKHHRDLSELHLENGSAGGEFAPSDSRDRSSAHGSRHRDDAVQGDRSTVQSSVDGQRTSAVSGRLGEKAEGNRSRNRSGTIVVSVLKYDGREHRRWPARIARIEGRSWCSMQFSKRRSNTICWARFHRERSALNTTGWIAGTTSFGSVIQIADVEELLLQHESAAEL